jgi:ribosomal protein L35AE/L33A
MALNDTRYPSSDQTLLYSSKGGHLAYKSAKSSSNVKATFISVKSFKQEKDKTENISKVKCYKQPQGLNKSSLQKGE